MNRRKRFGLLILAALAFSVLAFTRSDLQVPTPVDSAGYSDSAGTVADGAIDTPALTTTGTLDFIMPGVRVFSDSLVLSAVWVNYHTFYEDSGELDGLDTNFVVCPIVGDSTNTAIFPSDYHSWYANLTTGSNANNWLNSRVFVTGIIEGEGFWIRHRSYEVGEYSVQGNWWLVLRFSPP